jgi:hypothetical protein
MKVDSHQHISVEIPNTRDKGENPIGPGSGGRARRRTEMGRGRSNTRIRN